MTAAVGKTGRGLRDLTVESTTAAGNDVLDVRDLLRILIAIAGRVAFPQHQLQALVSPAAKAPYYRAYSMCNGQTPMAAIAKETGIDPGELSRAVARWVDAGIAFRVGTKALPLHLYPLTPPVDGSRGRRVRNASSTDTSSERGGTAE
jgi:hypothetical protein